MSEQRDGWPLEEAVGSGSSIQNCRLLAQGANGSKSIHLSAVTAEGHQLSARNPTCSPEPLVQLPARRQDNLFLVAALLESVPFRSKTNNNQCLAGLSSKQ